MTSQPSLQTFAIHLQFPNISQSKGNQTMAFGQLINKIREIFFLKNHTENKTVKLVPDLLFFLQKLYMR